ncbi:unnamed protein product [Blepharisma stoltei]|uniref:Transmembrane protein n=1 Tax=Blepharisma stoltei TaxID=1481888 RepID=A0AAU9KF39_9CILI|nr:unnamed protein product [Blepharisma stoltei]
MRHIKMTGKLVFLLSALLIIGNFGVSGCLDVPGQNNEESIFNSDSKLTAPPPIYPVNPSCGTSYAPLGIMAVIIFIILFFLPLWLVWDIYHEDPEDQKGNIMYVPPPLKSKADKKEPRDSGRAQIDILDDSVKFEEEPSKVIEPVAEAKYPELPVEKPRKKRERGKLIQLIESHLLFGMFFYRPSFTRVLRAFTLITVVMFEFMLEGAMLEAFENTDVGEVMDASDIMSNYKREYFAYMVLAIVIASPVEFYLSAALSTDRSNGICWVVSAIIFGFSVLIGSIAGIIVLSFQFCYEWSGYWCFNFLFGILIEIFIIQAAYMIIRFFKECIHSFIRRHRHRA